MAIAVHINPKQMSHADYQRVISDLRESGAGEPEGRSFHAAYGDDEVHMFEVWDSKEQFDEHSEKLFSTLQACQIDAGTIDMYPVHS